MICPCCGKDVPESHFSCRFSALGGRSGRGQAKARTSEQATKAINTRWEKYRERKAKERDNAS